MLRYEPMALTPADLESTSQLLTSVFQGADHLSARCLRWMYCENPAGQAIGFDVFDGDRLIGHYATVPFPARLKGQPRTGGQMVNLVTLPEYQRRGIAGELGRRVEQAAKERGIDHFVAMPNAISTRIFEQTYGFTLLGPLDARLGVGPLPPVRETVIDYERFWDAENLRWRLAHPEHPYSLQRRRRGVEVRAKTHLRGVVAVLAELSFEQCPEPSQAKRNPLRLWFGREPGRRWWGSAFWDIPQRLRPAPLNLAFKTLVEDALPSAERVRIRGIDCDAY